MTHHKICDECETVAHCTKHGCVPKQPAPVQEPVAIPEYIRDAAKHLHENRFEPSFMVRAIVGWINGSPPAAKRQWVGLTAGERDALFTEHYQWDDYGKAIEAKLKEKNT
jgi:hypothetical protein